MMWNEAELGRTGGVAAPGDALADEGGASVWLPGQFASFAAVPGDPGFSLESLFYVRNASAAAGVDFSRGGGLLAGLAINEQYLYLTPSYTFETPSNAAQIGLPFFVGYGWAHYSGANRWRTGLAIALMGVLLVLVAVVLGG
jgi:hypothetical protein